MTIVRGIWCDKCKVRYVYHVCKNGMPCKHHQIEVTENGRVIGKLATLIYCESWRYLEGFQSFILQQIYFKYDKEKEKWIEHRMPNKLFKASYITEEELKDKFLNFLKEIPVMEWTPFVEAFISLYYGGKSRTYPPMWRIKQIAKKISPIRGKQYG